MDTKDGRLHSFPELSQSASDESETSRARSLLFLYFMLPPACCEQTSVTVEDRENSKVNGILGEWTVALERLSRDTTMMEKTIRWTM